MSTDSPPVIRFDEVLPAPIRWLWEPYLARGKLALLDGDPGAGKSLVTADLAARLSRGGPLPDGSRLRRQVGRPVPQRRGRAGGHPAAALEAAGADLMRIYSLGGLRREDPAGSCCSSRSSSTASAGPSAPTGPTWSSSIR